MSAQQKFKGLAHGLELTAVSHASLYQEADASMMEHRRINDGGGRLYDKAGES